MKQFIYEILICLILFIVSLIVFSCIFDYGNEGDMKGWIETWVLSIILTSLGLYLIRNKDVGVKTIIKSIIIAGIVLAESYIIVVQMKVGLIFGAILLVFIPIIIPIHKFLVEKFITL